MFTLAKAVGADIAGGQFMTLPFDIGSVLQAQNFPTPLPPGETFPPTPALGPTTFLPTPAPTLGPMWISPTPAVKSCKELCKEMCSSGEYQVCSCHSPYAKPTEVACDAARVAIAALLSALLFVGAILM